MATNPQIQYLADAKGNPVSVLVPIALWQEIESERETAYLLKSKDMKKRLTQAQGRNEGISLKDARAKLGISPGSVRRSRVVGGA